MSTKPGEPSESESLLELAKVINGGVSEDRGNGREEEEESQPDVDSHRGMSSGKSLGTYSSPVSSIELIFSIRVSKTNHNFKNGIGFDVGTYRGPVSETPGSI